MTAHEALTRLLTGLGVDPAAVPAAARLSDLLVLVTSRYRLDGLVARDGAVRIVLDQTGRAAGRSRTT